MITDDIADLVVTHIERLPEDTQSMLQTAAAVGSEFSPEDLAAAAEVSAEEVLRRLEPALQAGLSVQTRGSIRLAHDKVQESAYSTIPADERPAFHHAIGRRILGASGKSEPERLLQAVEHFNAGRPPFTSRGTHRTSAFESSRRADRARVHRLRGGGFACRHCNRSIPLKRCIP